MILTDIGGVAVASNSTGIRGCTQKTKRRGKERYCAQKAIVYRAGRGFCYYHDPLAPHRFGEPNIKRQT